MEVGRGIVAAEVGLGMPETGLATGSLERRGMPLDRFGVFSMARDRRKRARDAQCWNWDPTRRTGARETDGQRVGVAPSFGS